MARCLVVALLVSVVVNASRADEGPAFVRTVEGITELKLANGMQVLLFPDVSRPNVTVNLTLFVGSRHEGYGEAGMAHLLEHMVFKGTPSRPTIPAELTKRGAQFNGTTWLDRTNYYETLSASDENLEFAISMEADRMINSLIKAEDLASEMTVVRNEFERGENSPQRVLMQASFFDGLRMAQLRQVHDRQSCRHRTSSRRKPSSLLQTILSARQRDADRGWKV